MAIEGISSWKFVAFMVVTYRQQLSAVSKSAISCPTPSILFCLRSICWYRNGLSVKEPVKAEFVFVAIATRRIGAMLKMFSWMNWFCLAGMIIVFAISPNNCFLQEHKRACPFFFCDNHPWEQYDECKVKNPQFQDWHWGFR